jgi:hypothetical protein
MDGTPYNKSQKRQKERNKNVGLESKIKINKKKNKKKVGKATSRARKIISCLRSRSFIIA